MTQLKLTMQTDQKVGSLKEELNAIVPQLEEMRKSKIERRNQFLDVIGQIQKLSSELYGSSGLNNSMAVVDENDLSLRRFEELQNHLQSLQTEKVHLIFISCSSSSLDLKLESTLTKEPVFASTCINFINVSTCRALA